MSKNLLVKLFLVLVVVLVIGGAGYAGWQVWKEKNEKQGKPLAEMEQPMTERTPDEQSKQEVTSVNWKIYQNEKYGFEVRYPANFDLEISRPAGIDTISFADKTNPTSLEPLQYTTINWIAIYNGEALINERLLSVKTQSQRWQEAGTVKINSENAIKFLPKSEREATLFLIRHKDIMLEIGIYPYPQHIELSSLRFNR